MRHAHVLCLPPPYVPQAAIAATDDYIAVVFRGTQEGADWWTNLKFLHRHFPSLGKVHEVSW